MDDEQMETMILSKIDLSHKALEEGVDHLIAWMYKQQHLPNVTDRALLKSFIVGSKSVERAKEKLDNYYSARTKYPIFFGNRDPMNIKWNQVSKTVRLPGLTPTGHHVFLIKAPKEKEEVDDFNYIEYSRMNYMLFERLYRTQPITSGQYVAIDFEGASLDLATKCFTKFTPAGISIYQSATPIRMSGIIFFNACPAADLLCNKVLKLFLNEKLRERIHVHRENHEILSEYFPLEMLPKDYGGSAPSMQHLMDNSRKDLESEREWFLTEGSVGTDDSKRILPNNNLDQVQGTFRKLEID